MDQSLSPMNSWLRRLAMKHFDLVDGCSYRGLNQYVLRSDAAFDLTRGQLRQAYTRIDELNQLLDGYRKAAWRPALRQALDDQRKAANE